MKKGLSLIVAFGLLGVPHAAGAAIPVTTAVDEFPAGNPPNTAACSLREAISQANADGVGFGGCAAAGHNDLILLPPGAYELEQAGAGEDANTTGDFDIGSAAATGSLTIVATGPGPSIIDSVGATDRAIHAVDSVLTVDGLTIRNGFLGFPGAGIFNSGGQLTVRNSTIEGNTGSVGGGIASTGEAVTIENSTLSDNFGFGNDGGGLAVSGAGNTATLRSVTVTSNRVSAGDEGAGIDGDTGTVVTLSNTIVGGNADINSVPADCDGGLVSAGNNLIADSAACPGFSSLATDLLNADPLLDPLASNGGLTQTHALQTGSSAIDKGAGCLVTDQRGVARAGACDIGAFEFIPAPVAQLVSAQPASAQPPAVQRLDCKKGSKLKKIKRKGKKPKRKCVKKKKRK